MLFKRLNQQNHFHLRLTGLFSGGVPTFVRVLINVIWFLQSKWVPTFMGCFFSVGAYFIVFATCGSVC